MMDFISRYVSAISLFIVTALAIFNIGYFWKIGLHFIGLADLTNLVYSAALSLVALVVWFSVFAFLFPKTPSRWTLILAGLVGGLLVLWGVLSRDTRTLEPKLFEHALTLVGLAVSSAALSSWMLTSYRNEEQWDKRNVALFCLMMFSTLFEAGSFAAALELTDRRTYTLSTNSGVHERVRILRASSSGFLIENERETIFIPHGEIRNVKSNPFPTRSSSGP